LVRLSTGSLKKFTYTVHLFPITRGVVGGRVGGAVGGALGGALGGAMGGVVGGRVGRGAVG
jgi:hypothetical protein